MRLILGLIFVGLGGCATQNSGVTSNTARFSEFPAELFFALEEACNEPAQEFHRNSQNSIECREFLEPGLTASAILRYGGTPQDLPQLVIQFQARPDGQDFLLETNTFLNVPRPSGGPVHVEFPNPAIDRKLAQMYRLAGGVPE